MTPLSANDPIAGLPAPADGARSDTRAGLAGAARMRA